MKNQKNSFVIKAVGDICPGDKSILGLGVCSLMKKFGADFSLRNVRGMFDDADIVIINLEGLLTRIVHDDSAETLTFSGPPSFADALADAGITALNVANNHILEHGPAVFNETLRHVENAGIKICGLRDQSSQYWSKPVFFEKNGITTGIIGYNWVGIDKFDSADEFIAQSRDSLVNYTWKRTPDADRKNRADAMSRNRHVIEDIKRLRQEVDFLILNAHWGFEFVHFPPYGVTMEAKSFIDAGADLIIGHHPHVIQGVEQYKGKHIFYSLGNFIFDMRLKKTRYSAILEYSWNKLSGGSYKLTPIIINKSFQPDFAAGYVKEHIDQIFSNSGLKIHASERERILDDDTIYKEYERQYRNGKIRQVFDHFAAIPKNPWILKLIADKAIGAVKLTANRIRGEKVRW